MIGLLRRYVCWLVAHRWAVSDDATVLYCSRCRRTHGEIARRRLY